MKKVLVFGANGYIGRHIAYKLKESYIKFIPIGHSSRSVDNHTDYIQADITDLSALSKIDFDVDYVFMFAGLTGTKSDEESKRLYDKVNEEGLKNVLECCKGGKAQVVFPSSRLVYKGVENTSLSELAENEAKTVYAQNKINCEKILKEYQIKYGINYTVFRICVSYGNLIDSNYSYGTLGFFLGKATQGDNITLFGDGLQKRTFTHVSDIVDIIFNTLKFSESVNNIFNIGSKDSKSLLEVAKLVADKYSVEVEHVEWPEEALKIESGDTIFDDEKIISLTGYNYQYNLTNWIEEI